MKKMKKKVFIDFAAMDKFPEINYAMLSNIRRAVVQTLAHENFPYNARVSITFCDNAFIRRLNNSYRHIDRPTDVLSFPLYEDGVFDPVECVPEAMLGDIVISLERAAEQADQIGHSLIREVAFLAVHSTLHLLGYDHERSAEDEEKQCAAQREIFAAIGGDPV